MALDLVSMWLVSLAALVAERMGLCAASCPAGYRAAAQNELDRGI